MTDRPGPINPDLFDVLHGRLKAAEATCNQLFASIPLICSACRAENNCSRCPTGTKERL